MRNTSGRNNLLVPLARKSFTRRKVTKDFANQANVKVGCDIKNIKLLSNNILSFVPVVKKGRYNNPVQRLISKNRMLAVNIEENSTRENAGSNFGRADRIKKSPSAVSTDSAQGSSVDFEIEHNTNIGDLFWGQLGSLPYWPSIVWPDEKGRTIMVRGSKHDSQEVRIHVCFFAKDSRNAWIKRSSLIPFVNRYDYDRRKHEAVIKYGKSGPNSKHYIIKPEDENRWNQAVQEAEKFRVITPHERKIEFEKILEVKITSKNDLSKRSSKRTIVMIEKEEMLFHTKYGNVDREPTRGLCINNCCPKNVDFAFLKTNVEFRKFFEEIKKEILMEDNKGFESCLLTNVKNLWLIKNYKKVSGNADDINTKELRNDRMSQRGSKKRKISKPILEVVLDILELERNYLFRNLKREHVCKVCLMPKELVKCFGWCQSWIHRSCGEEIEKKGHVTGDVSEGHNVGKEILCPECSTKDNPRCFLCDKNDPSLGECISCNITWCGKFYHAACLKYWPQSRLSNSSAKIERLLCPGHVCHTCVSDDPRNKFFQIDKMKLVKCVKCPATYHLDSYCIPAGTKFLTAIQIICPRHRRLEKSAVNANICFICAKGGSLLCCDTCPLAFHIECLKISKPEGNYICEECETGRLPLYGELVWAKLGNYRWWPGIIVPPPEIPENLHKINHDLHDICVRFLGSHDHAWLSRNRIFLYQEGDGKEMNKSARGLDQTFLNGLEEARTILNIIEDKKRLKNDNKKEKSLAPAPYVKIKTNRILPPVKPSDLEVDVYASICNCKPEIDPCGIDSNCVNRSVMTPCGKDCPTGTLCENQSFGKRMHLPLKVTQTKTRGWGLVCEKPLKRGSFIIEYVGEVINKEEFLRRVAHKREQKDENYYFLSLINNCMIDAGPKGNLARFINHSCEPNCVTQKWSVNGVVRVGIFAIRDIPAETELTFDYSMPTNTKCNCGADKCAGFIGKKYAPPVEKISKKDVKIRKRKRVKTAKRESA